MTSKTIEDILASVQNSSTLSTPQKKDIDSLLNAIDAAIVPLAAEEPEAAKSILNFLTCALFESTRKDRVSVIAMAARKGMLLSFRPHEAKYPSLTSNAYSLGDVLAALGV